LLNELIGGFYDRTERRIAHAEEGLEQRLAEHEDRIKRHFDVTVEAIRHDLLGANRDEIEAIKDRIAPLEQHMGLVSR
jgi:hypothetical protein